MSRTPSFEVIINSAPVEAAPVDTGPVDRDPGQWHQAVGVARHVCARIFRDGGKPADAVATFGVDAATNANLDWSRAVEMIAQNMCAQPQRRAA